MIGNLVMRTIKNSSFSQFTGLISERDNLDTVKNLSYLESFHNDKFIEDSIYSKNCEKQHSKKDFTCILKGEESRRYIVSLSVQENKKLSLIVSRNFADMSLNDLLKN